MASMSDVKRIYLDWRGICHIVASERAGWVHTLCESMQTGQSMETWPLKPRLCRKCRKNLKIALVIRDKREAGR